MFFLISKNFLSSLVRNCIVSIFFSHFFLHLKAAVYQIDHFHYSIYVIIAFIYTEPEMYSKVKTQNFQK